MFATQIIHEHFSGGTATILSGTEFTKYILGIYAGTTATPAATVSLFEVRDNDDNVLFAINIIGNNRRSRAEMFEIPFIADNGLKMVEISGDTTDIHVAAFVS